MTIDGRSVVAATGDITVGINSSGKAYVGALNTGDKFTIDGTTYEMTTIGLIKGSTAEKIVYKHDATFILDDEIDQNILAVNGTNLDLTNQTASAYVYDNLITLKLGELTVEGSMTLAGESSASPADKVKTIDIAECKCTERHCHC